jgi:hypothetical protein
LDFSIWASWLRRSARACSASQSAEAWVKDKATEVLRSKASVVAGAIRRKATCLGLEPSRRANADTCADYLLAKSKYLDYATALQKGWPIATGIIETTVAYCGGEQYRF